MQYTIITRNWTISVQNDEIQLSQLKDYSSEDFSNQIMVCQETITALAKDISDWNIEQIASVKRRLDNGNFDILNDTIPQKLLTNVKP